MKMFLREADSFVTNLTDEFLAWYMILLAFCCYKLVKLEFVAIIDASLTCFRTLLPYTSLEYSCLEFLAIVAYYGLRLTLSY